MTVLEFSDSKHRVICSSQKACWGGIQCRDHTRSEILSHFISIPGFPGYKLIGVLFWVSAHSSPTAPSQDKSAQSSRRSFESGHSPFFPWVLLLSPMLRSRRFCHWKRIGMCLSCLFGSGPVKTRATASLTFKSFARERATQSKEERWS